MSLPEMLIRQSNLTEKQLESLERYMRVSSGEMRYREAAASMSRPVTIGSYYRTLQQGRENVRDSIVTVLVAMAIGLVKTEDVRRLFELVGKVGTELAEENRERFSEVLGALLDKIVM
jgi:hypothetical protein